MSTEPIQPLKRLFNDVPLGVVEFAVEIRTGEEVG